MLEAVASLVERPIPAQVSRVQDPLGVMVRTRGGNPHNSSPSVNILWSEKLHVCKKTNPSAVLTLNRRFCVEKNP